MKTAMLLCICTVLLAACTTTKGSFCQIAQPIRLSGETIDHLSDEEVSSVLAANEKGRKLCGWKP